MGESGMLWQFHMSPDVDTHITEEEYKLGIKALELTSNELKRRLSILKRENLNIKNEINKITGEKDGKL